MGFFDDTTKPKADGSALKGFAQSALSAPFEVFGADPSVDVLAFRREHPWGSIGSQLLGAAVPYVGWEVGATRVPAFMRAINAIGDVEKAPIVTGALREAAKFVPFEAGRVAVSTTAGGEDPGKEVWTSVLNLGATGAVGGVIGGLRAAGGYKPQIPLADIVRDVDPQAPLQLRLRQFQDAMLNGKVNPDKVEIAQNRYSEWLRAARREEPEKVQRYVDTVEGDPKGDLTSTIERQFFQTTEDVGKALRRPKGIVTRQFTTGKRGFADDAAWKDAASAAGFDPEDMPLRGQFWRFSTPQNEAVAKSMENTAKKMISLGDGVFISRESKPGGAWVVLKKLEDYRPGPTQMQPWMRPWVERVRLGEDPNAVFKEYMTGSNGKLRPNDNQLFQALEKAKGSKPRFPSWVATKTDDPSLFKKDFVPWDDMQMRAESWFPPTHYGPDAGGDIFKVGKNYQDVFSLVDYAEMQKTGTIPGAVRKATGEMGARLEAATTHWLTPAMNQFSKSPVLNWVMKGVETIYDAAEEKITKVMQGARKAGDKVSPLASILKGNTREITGGLQPLVDALTPEQFATFVNKVLNPGLDGKELATALAQGDIDEVVADFAKRLSQESLGLIASRNATAKIVGKDAVKPLQGHYLISRSWEGAWRQGLVDSEGNLIGLAAAHNTNGLEREARFIQKKLAEEGKLTTLGKVWDSSSKAPPPPELMSLKSKGYANPRTGVRGHKWDFGRVPTKEEFLKELRSNVADRVLDDAQMSVEALYAQHLAGIDDPHLLRIATERINQYYGKLDEMTGYINRGLDPILGPMLGAGSAGKIVNSVNKNIFSLSFGWLNFAFPTTQIMGVLQTVAPEVAYVMTAPGVRAAGFYVPQLVMNSARKPAGIMHVFSPVKAMWRGMKLMGKPTEELQRMIVRATDEAVLDPKFIEDYVGQNTAQLRRVKETLQDPKKWWNYINALSEYMPAVSERATRTYAFTTAYDIGKNALALEGEALYEFAKRFVHRTQYRYAARDRSFIFNNPVGNLFGSMKNWVSHYLSNMMLYAGEATRGNAAPLAWQMATTGMIGGLAAMPFAPTIGNLFAQANEQENLVSWVYGAMGQRAGDALYLGLPAAMGMSFSNMTASPLRDANMLFNFVQWDRAKAIGTGIGAAVDQWLATGEHPATSEVARGALARGLAPKTMYRYLQVYDNPGIESLTTGNSIVDEVSPWNKLLFTMGFAPTDIERANIEFDILMKDKNARMTKIGRYGAALAGAFESGDYDAAGTIFSRAMLDGIDTSSVMNSASARMSKHRSDMLDRNFKAEDRIEEFGNE